MREVRDCERVERKRVLELEMSRKRRLADFASSLLMHAEEFKTFHREARRGSKKVANIALSSFDTKARKERRDGGRAQRERLRALKENNMTEYMKVALPTYLPVLARLL